ncbi:hypothetical protein ANCCAN_02769 [Ancylostoma caninum]|uniref:Uncharacterized protein n=1 Tax=Ancylostoma caninum TaxID=29170 RepID=A0A368H310_ANCCA|nr:hypothetical protein ANCCAN_02769 [Ancylostoma caninum]
MKKTEGQRELARFQKGTNPIPKEKVERADGIQWIKFEKHMNMAKLGQQWANEIGPNCEFILVSSSQFDDGKRFLEELTT